MRSKEQKDESRRQEDSRERNLSEKAVLGANNPSVQGEPVGKENGSAHTPPEVMTVEYIDESEGMDTALKVLQERADSLEGLLNSLEESHGELVSAFNQQSKELQKFVSSVGRRIASIQKTLASVSGELEKAVEEVTATPEIAEEGMPEQFANDASHQEAWRTARILAAELEAFYPDEVRKGIINGNFHELLSRQLEEALKIYKQGVPETVVQEYDYFSAAIEALIARKERESEA